MSNNNQDPLAAAKQAERELNSYGNKQGLNNKSDSVNESGIDVGAAERFPGGTATYGSAASGAGDNREIPESEGGDITKTGQPTKARDFEGVGGPEDKDRLKVENRGGDDGVRGNIRN